VSPKSYVQIPFVNDGALSAHRYDARGLASSTCRARTATPAAKVRSAAYAADHHVGVFTGFFHLLQRFFADNRFGSST
jgi:hypothetical protein